MANDNISKDEQKKRQLKNVELLSSWQEERGGIWNVPTYWAIQDKLNALEVKEGDVWIASYPKSGTTWTQEMVWLLTHNLDYEGAKALLKYRSPGTEYCYMRAFFGIPGTTVEEFERYSFSAGGRRVLKTHLLWDLMPEKLRDPNTPAKIIYVARNPKDTCISHYYYHIIHEVFDPNEIPLDDFCHTFMYGKTINGPYWRHVKDFWNRRNNRNILFLKYEDMKKDLQKVISDVAEFLEVPVPGGEEMKKLLDHLSFESMKKNPAVNRAQGDDRLQVEKSENGSFIRKGIVGDWKQKMSQGRIKEFDEWIKENLKDTELQFDFGA